MKIFPAIDLRDGQVVRLLKGDYDQMTVYGDDPLAAARNFEAAGAEYLHVVDLDGARDGDNPNFDVVRELAAGTGLKVEIGGGIRNEETIRRYLDAGVCRVILGTIAVKDPAFTAEMIGKYGDRIAVGVDISDRKAAVHGWKEVSEISVDQIFERLSADGVSCIICTDISRDGAMKGTNRELYRELMEKYPVDIVASGGVSSMEDVRALAEMGICGAIIGKALYTGDIDLKEAISAAACTDGGTDGRETEK
ncbi:MAG: 1-(5-phosphoribosyl)-5-[(5-phosphoribosylamino)methylideneamino]imidazole-4-carboxamide isomerase [Emergencia sp.]